MVRGSVPRVFRFRGPVWQADLDAFGELRSATMLRFLQETATRASTDAGFDPAFYERQGSLWLVRRTALTRLAPAHYGDEIEATTWVADFRRVRSRRDYEVRAGDRLVAQASTDWVYVDRATTRPRRVPHDMQVAFLPEEAPSRARAPFPESTPPGHASRTTRRIELHDLDALGHVNNATYLHYVEQGAEDAQASLGWPLATQLAAGGRFRAVAHDLEYLDAALYGEEIDVLTWPLAVADDGIERSTLLVRRVRDRPERSLVRIVSRYTWVSAADGLASPMPTELRRALHDSV